MSAASSHRLFIALLVVALAAGGAAWWWQRQSPPVVPEVAALPPAAPASAAPPAATAEVGAIRHPVDPPDNGPGPADLESVLVDLFGRTALSMFTLEDFPRRIAATVDNLGRSAAPVSVWPVHPTRDRFLTETRGDSATISADNALRYTPFVLMVEGVDLKRAVAAYRRLYPAFQQAYEDLGYPGRYFNDRVVEVIDLMLATPDLDRAPGVHLAPVSGPIRPQRPWVTYQFDDPALERLAAGQKMLLRMGPVNERRMKARLAELRALLVKPKAGAG